VHFLSRTQVIVAIGAVLLAVYVLDLVRRRKLSEEYSFLWVLTTVTVAVLGFSTPILVGLTRLLGVVMEVSTVFAVGIGFALTMLLYLSVRLSRLGVEKDALVRELALLRYEFESERRASAERSGR
jgi:hypothetical protein